MKTAAIPDFGISNFRFRTAARGARLLAGVVGAGLWVAAGAAVAQPPAPAAAASAPQAAASNPASILPQWAQDRLAAAKEDPKLYEKAYKHGAKLALFCENCHGPAGQSTKPEVPNLAGQNTIYVLNQLNKFYEGKRRGATFMEGLVKAMSLDERFAVAVYYTHQQPQPVAARDAALAARGKGIYDELCRKCHGADGAGSEKNSRIASQHPDYLDRSLRRYRDNQLRPDARMYKYSKTLTDPEIRALAAYIAAMP